MPEYFSTGKSKQFMHDSFFNLKFMTDFKGVYAALLKIITAVVYAVFFQVT